MKYAVSFIKVGREKMSWDETLNGISDTDLFRAIKRKGALSSSDVDFSYDEEDVGHIYAGGRKVGAFEVGEVKG